MNSMATSEHGAVIMNANPLRRCFLGGVSALIKDRAGSTLPLFAASIIPIMGAIGLSVDAGRAYMVQQRVKSALDLALLASATSGATQAERDATMEQYFRANFPDDYLGAKIEGFSTNDQRQANAQGTSVDVTASVSITLPTTFMSVFGERFKELTITAESRAATAERGDKQALEIVMAIDNTGSMSAADVGGGLTRIQAVKNAAQTFTDIIYNGSFKPENLAIGIVPFTVMANVGRVLKDDRVNYAGAADYANRAATDAWGWKGCVTEDGWLAPNANYATRSFPNKRTSYLSNDRTVLEATAYDMNLADPATSAAPKWDPLLFPPVYLRNPNVQGYYRPPSNAFATDPNSIWNKAIRRAYTTRGVSFINTSTNHINITTAGLFERPSSSATRYYTKNNGGTDWVNSNQYTTATLTKASPNFHCPSQALPPKWGVTKTAVSNYIANENWAYNPGTGTLTNVGFAWAWRMLKAKDMFKDVVSHPQDYPTRQILVLFTDGIIESFDNGNYWNGKRDTNYTPYGTFEDKIAVNSTNSGTVNAAMDLRLAKACNAAKATGVEIYVIALKASTNTYRECASGDNHYFATYNAVEISDAFQAIAYDLVPLHIAQ